MDSIQKVWIIIEEGAKETLLVTPLGDNYYRLESTPFLTFDIELYWKDVIEASILDDGTLVYQRTVEYAPLKHVTYILSEKVVESVEFKDLLEAIKTQGGFTEVFMGGVLFCHLPENSSFDIDTPLKEIAKKVQSL